MSPERWSRIKDTFDRVLDEPAELRPVLVRSACRDEPDLEAEILLLLQAHDTSSGFLEQAAANLHDYLQPAANGPALQPGTILARRFEVRNFINAGGMGEVYEAWDADLDEAVALKTILPHIAANPAIIERFKHEVRHAREVSHPNICRVHELFCDDSATGERRWFLSMELLRGTTLLERIQTSGGLPADDALHIAAQLLAGLEAAHARGLVHRDFKSSNVMLLQQPGAPPRAVITDFGLAIGNLPGIATPTDTPGTGTPGYMAPEQARGDAVGQLADQYSFGVVLCDMMTGTLPQTRPAESKSRPAESSTRPAGSSTRPAGSSTRTAVLKSGPDVRKSGPGAWHTRPAAPRALPSARQSGYPAVWHTVIRRCTQHEPTARFRDMAAVRATLLPSFWQRRGGLVIAAGVLVLVAFAVAMRRRGPQLPIPCSICDVTQLTPDTDKSESPSVSGDGRFVAYSSDRADTGNLDIFVQALPFGQLTRITRDSARDTTPSLSPNGSIVAFRSERGGGGVYIGTVGDTAGPKLLVAGGRNPKLSPDGKSLLYWTGDPDSSVESGRIFRIDLPGGKPQPIAATFADARYPVWSPDGSRVLFTGCSTAGQLLPDCFDWWIANTAKNPATQRSIGGSSNVIQTFGYAALRAQNLLPGRLTSLEWKDDQIIFSAVSELKRLNLASITLDPSSLHVTGLPQWLLKGLGGDVDPSLAANNRIAFTRTSGALHIWQLSGIAEHRKPVFEKITADAEVDGSPFVSEGGRYLVFARGRSLKRIIVLRDVTTGQDTVIVNAGTPVQSPIIDSTGTWIAYQQTEPDGSSAIYAGARGGAMKHICSNCTEPSGWFNGGKAFFFRDGADSISTADPRTGQKHTVLNHAGGSEGDANWSAATGSLVLITSRNKTRQIEVVHLDPTTAQPVGEPIPVSEEHGTPLHPRWFGDGKGIVYVSSKDGFLCIYGRIFHKSTQTFGEPFSIAHFHAQRASIDDVFPRVFNLSADGDTFYLNLGEQNSTIEIGQLEPHP